MTTVVVMPGGFHPFHAGHMSLYNSARKVFPDADVYVAATNDTSSRPFPFAVKEKLAKLAGVEPGHFVQVKSPFRAEEITAKFDPNKDTLIFVRSEKDAESQPKPGGVKKDGSPAYLQPLLGAKKLEPFSKHAYMAYLPTVEFGPGMTSATQIRTAWPTLNEKRKTALVMSLYPAAQKNPQLAATVVKLLDAAIGGDTVSENQGWAATFTNEQEVDERREKQDVVPAEYRRDPELYKLRQYARQHYSQYADDPEMAIIKLLQRGLEHSEVNDKEHDRKLAALSREIQSIRSEIRQHQNTDYIEEKWSQKYKSSINCANPKGFSQRAHCAGRKK